MQQSVAQLENVDIAIVQQPVAQFSKVNYYLSSPLLISISWRIDWFLSTFFGRKRKLDRATASNSNSQKLLSNEKIKTALGIDFLDVHHYIKEISRL